MSRVAGCGFVSPGPITIHTSDLLLHTRCVRSHRHLAGCTVPGCTYTYRRYRLCLPALLPKPPADSRRCSSLPADRKLKVWGGGEAGVPWPGHGGAACRRKPVGVQEVRAPFPPAGGISFMWTALNLTGVVGCRNGSH